MNNIKPQIKNYLNYCTLQKRKDAFRDAAVCELLFATGMRISELCSLNTGDVNLHDGIILIYGKGSKERRIQIGNQDVIASLESYKSAFSEEMAGCCSFFVNQSGSPLSDQPVRRMINKYTKLAAIDLHITPHMFRHPYIKPTTKNVILESRNPKLLTRVSLGFPRFTTYPYKS